jgi:hypothetical protein
MTVHFHFDEYQSANVLRGEILNRPFINSVVPAFFFESGGPKKRSACANTSNPLNNKESERFLV